MREETEKFITSVIIMSDFVNDGAARAVWSRFYLCEDGKMFLMTENRKMAAQLVELS